MSGKALVTGGAGFIGSHLVDRLIDDEWEVLAVDDLSKGHLDRLADARQIGRVHFHQLDICSDEFREAVRRFEPDVIHHLAAQSGVRPSVEDPVFDARVNVLGTINVLLAAAEAEAQRVVFASSGGAMFGEVPGDPVTEDAPAFPDSPYGISKKIVEDYFRYFRQVAGVDYVILALGNVYGPRQDPYGEAGVVAIFSRQMLDGKRPVINGDGEQARDYVFIDDIVDAFARAGEIGGGVRLNIGTGLATTVNDLYTLIARAAAYDGSPEHGPAMEGDLARSVIDASAAKAHLGWEPWTALETGIEKTVRAFRAG
ncbi:MAG: GDP-mannose 4,6-dehydratase [Acidimicrobiia bacterium]|nr:GDP-mannose 4,6-dehydratase [Acidimicrobiia bacterium]